MFVSTVGIKKSKSFLLFFLMLITMNLLFILTTVSVVNSFLINTL